jgi:hypothetical protein
MHGAIRDAQAHYGFHMPLWFIPQAMTGQLYSAVDSTLSFTPQLPCPFSLPMLVTGAVGVLTCWSFSFLPIVPRKFISPPVLFFVC